ncbi:multidrug ABC transporter ATPase (plasmid) [Haloferax mediterranei ATCC 33500]|nr:DUF6498-containing protein [Haloferax mediterranei]AHZ24702.1 multidrug ABC transporter ATPase [Haloferax mediterranei ATCC 33500]ELZ97485.1 hypothetical protein C439_19223 [Haloferax mediterranei ATCC 33500]MDX5990223.1 DUF6498-containing protein [Haloferax mediterranei ATCC 33500]QCQ76707.1 multidrug ABC transporter ATPase [Haloferax mediterranei ATCC 33500]
MDVNKYRRTLSVMALSNLVLLMGVFEFSWDPHLVLLFYWFEAGVAVTREAAQSLFAALPPSKEYRPTGTRAPFPLKILADVRGGFRPARWLPPVYPQNVPYTLLTLIPLVAFWPFGGLMLTGVVTPVVETFVLPVSAALGVLAILVSQLFKLVDWFQSGEYETVSATGGVSKTHLALLFILAFVAPFVVGVVEAAGVTRVELGLVLVGSKVVYDVLELRNPGFVQSAMFIDKTAGEESTVEVPDGEPVAAFHTDQRAEFTTSVFVGVLSSFLGPTLFFVLLGGLTGMLVGSNLFGTPHGPAIGVVAGAAVVVAVRVLAQLAVGWIVGGHLVYRVYPDAVVAHNTLTSEAQWSIPREDISDVTIGDGFLASRLPDWFGTVRLDRYNGESHKIAYLTDVDAVAQLLDA